MEPSDSTPEDGVQAVLAERYGLSAACRPLPGERDLNYHVSTAGGDQYILKLGTSEEDAGIETAALSHLAAGDLATGVQRVVRAADGAEVVAVRVGGHKRYGRLLTWVAGRTWLPGADAEPERLSGLGVLVAGVDAALASFSHPAAGRSHRWNLATAKLAFELSGHVDAAKRGLVDRIADRYATWVSPRLSAQPAQPLHNDANENNVILDERGHIAGLIDFGDVVTGPRVCGLAVACAYAMQDQPDPVRAVTPLVAGYHGRAPLRPAELELLFDLIRTRLATSVCMAAWQRSLQPENEYLLVSQPAIWETLTRLERQDEDLAHFRFRDACGFEANPRARGVRAFLARGEPPASVLPVDLRAGGVAVDWSSENAPELDMSAPERLVEVARAIIGSLDAGAAGYGIGAYGENRAVYRGDAFVEPDGQRRTTHLGVDLFVRPGTPVRAPLAGTVCDAADLDTPLDYGPVVVLEHRTDEDTPFWTLYGHLSRASLTGLRRGRRVGRGEAFAEVGSMRENGGWPPHVHLQLLTHVATPATATPGVAACGELDLWRSLSPDPNHLVGRRAGLTRRAEQPAPVIARIRRANLSAALSLSYAEPLHIVRGRGAYLYDRDGRDYLDLVNNVAHVGHCHPRVVAAAHDQAAQLNTNTRYLHAAISEYTRELLATLPDPLSVCFLVNSGSEANDLALRLAEAHTGHRNWIVLDHAYHGHLSSTIDLSPYKFNGAGGRGRPDHVRVSPSPDAYRGRYRGTGDPAELARAYAAGVADAVAELVAAGMHPGAFVAEPIQGCGGQVVPPPGFLTAAFDHARAAGAVCVADEVQVGFGRVGEAFWAFDQQGAVPDIVTMGKPIGNGHPMAAVVTTPQVAASFATGMEYFNTFGGNPVSCRVGLAVLDVIRDERLQHRAARLGRALKEGLTDLQDHHEVVGDVRGEGLFLGLDLVLDRQTREPATFAAAAVKEAAKRRGLLLSTDGPHDNVLKIKPPLVLGQAECDRIVETLGASLAEAGQALYAEGLA